MFELLDINHAGTITFGEFIQCIVVMCLFEKDEVMKFCFYVFDKDKNGYVEKAELDTMLHVFHHVGAGEKLKGNPKKARGTLKLPDDAKVEFQEVEKIAEKFPSLWYPSLRIQNNMMVHYMGEGWWIKKKRQLQDLKDLKARRKAEKALEAEAKFERLRQRKIRKKMGLMKYYSCPWNRKQWDKMFPRHMADASTALSAEELAALRKKAREEAKRLEELLIKNPETQEWRNYCIEKDKKLKIKLVKEKAEADGTLAKPRVKASVSERVARTERRREKFDKKHG